MGTKQKTTMILDQNQVQNSTNTSITDIWVVKLNPYAVNLSGYVEGQINYV